VTTIQSTERSEVSVPGQAAASKPRSGRASLSTILERFGLPILFVLLAIVFAFLRPDTFPTTGNWRSIATSQSVLAVAAIALVFPLVAGRFDISVGAIVGVSSIATAGAMSKSHLPLLAAIGIAMLLSSTIGLVNGFLVAYLGINSIISTLGMSTVLGGLVFAYTQGIPISSGLSAQLTNLSVRGVLQIPVLFVIMLLIAAAAWAVLSHSTYGRYLTAVGSNEVAANLTGLPIRRIVLLSFVCSGFLAGCAGVLQVAAQGNGNPGVGGISFMLPSLAAVFLGATTLIPGTYNVPGTIVALFFVGTAVSGLTLLGVQPWITDVFNGAAVIIAVGLAAHFRRRRTGTVALGQ
jgi:ribose transport system permease protein